MVFFQERNPPKRAAIFLSTEGKAKPEYDKVACPESVSIPLKVTKYLE